MDYKKSKGRSKPTKDKGMEKQMPTSPLLSPIALTGNEVYGVSALQHQTGGSTDLFSFIAKDIPVDPRAILTSSTSLNPLLEPMISELIKAYATARGYTTSTTYAEVSEYVYKSLDALSLLMHMFRAQNVANVVSDNGSEIGTVLASRPSVRVSGSAIPEYIINDTAVNARHVNDGAVSISAKDWSEDWLSYLVHFKLSKPLVKWAASLFTVFYQHTLSDGQTVMYSFIPEVITNSLNVAVKTKFDAYVSDLATLRSNRPDIVDILNFLGFTNEDVVSMDFTRDLRQLTLPVVVDENILAMYINTNLEGIADDDTDVADLYFDPSGQFNALNYPSDVQLNADIIFSHRYMRNAVYQHTVYKRASSTSYDLNVEYYPFPIGLGSFYSSLSLAQTNRLAYVRRKYQTSGLPRIPYATEVELSDLSGTPIFSGSANVEFYVVDSANTYRLPDTFDFYESAKKAEIIMNDVAYRTKLQLLSNSIRTNSITKSS